MSPSKIDPKKDKNLLIHQTLAYGSMADIKKLFKIYSKTKIKKVFLEGKRGIYDSRAVAWLKLVFEIKHLDQNKYVKKI